MLAFLVSMCIRTVYKTIAQLPKGLMTVFHSMSLLVWFLSTILLIQVPLLDNWFSITKLKVCHYLVFLFSYFSLFILQMVVIIWYFPISLTYFASMIPLNSIHITIK